MYNSDLLNEDYDLYDIFIEEPAIKLDNKLETIKNVVQNLK